MIDLAHGATNALIKNKIETINAQAKDGDPELGFFSSALLYVSSFYVFDELEESLCGNSKLKDVKRCSNQLLAHGIGQLISEEIINYKYNPKKGISLRWSDINIHFYVGLFLKMFGGQVKVRLNG